MPGWTDGRAGVGGRHATPQPSSGGEAALAAAPRCRGRGLMGDTPPATRTVSRHARVQRVEVDRVRVCFPCSTRLAVDGRSCGPPYKRPPRDATAAHEPSAARVGVSSTEEREALAR
eukprot:scaffold3431_cov307-Prasinococcus_capsulatus_cf.AAC.5